MTYSVAMKNFDDDPTVYLFTDDNSLVTLSCTANYEPFQQWLRDNADNLPADIQAKVEAGELTIQEADAQ